MSEALGMIETKGFVALADASGQIPAAAVTTAAALKDFVPSTFFAVTLH